MAENKLGRFVWYDLMTTDKEAAQAFYSKVIGWGTMEWDGPTPYTMWTHAPGTALGGIMSLPDEAKASGAPPHWLAYVSTPDCAATARKAVELGGKILKEPTEIPGTGRFAVLADPQGAVFAVYQSDSGMPEDAPAEVKQFSWHELATTDHDAAFTFYAACSAGRRPMRWIWVRPAHTACTDLRNGRWEGCTTNRQRCRSRPGSTMSGSRM